MMDNIDLPSASDRQNQRRYSMVGLVSLAMTVPASLLACGYLYWVLGIWLGWFPGRWPDSLDNSFANSIAMLIFFVLGIVCVVIGLLCGICGWRSKRQVRWPPQLGTVVHTVLLVLFLLPLICRAKPTHGKLQRPNPALPKEMTFDLGNGVKLDLVLNRAGVFLMGDDDYGDSPIHMVAITKPFYLGKYLVTQEQWQAVMGSNPSHWQGRPKNPVESVSWDDCQAFLEKLNASVAGGKGRFALPTEAQWEYACRAGSTTKYCFGDDWGQLGEYAWYGQPGYNTSPVGKKKPNAWGLYDMHGNVSEWCQDWYDEYYYVKSPTDDPTGPSTGSYPKRHVQRGKSTLAASPGECTSANRSSQTGSAYIDLGLRVSLVPADK